MLFATTDGQLNALAITPDGAQIITGGDNGVIIWDRTTGRQVQHMTGHTTPVRALAVTPSGREVVSSSAGGTVRIWDRATGEQLREPFAGHSGLTMALTPDGNQIISGNDNGELIIWNRDRGDEFGRPLPTHNGDITAIAVTPDGQHVISAGRDEIRVTNLATGNSRALGASGGSTAMAIAEAPDGSQIISAHTNGDIRVWDSITRQPLHRHRTGHIKQIEYLAVDGDGRLLTTASADGEVRVWDLVSKEPIGEPFTGHNGPVHAVAFTPDGSQIVSAGKDGTIHLWGRTGPRVLRGHRGRVHAVAVAPDGSRVIAGGVDGTVLIWDRVTGELANTLTGSVHTVNAVGLLPDGRIVAGGDDHILRVWDGDSSFEIQTGHTGGIRALAMNGYRIISAGWDRTIQTWDHANEQPVGELPTDHTGGIRALALSPDGSRLISGGADNTVRIWDRVNEVPVGEPLTGHTASVNAAAVSPDGTQIISAGDDGTVRIWDRATGAQLNVLSGHVGKVWAVVLTPDGGQIVSGGQDGTIRVWNRFTGRPVETLTGHVGEVYALAVAGARFVSGGEDGTVRIWELADIPAVRPVPLAEVVSDLESVEDRLGITGDVHTIAAVVAALSTRPPLSVALLGDWGAGKSSFMRQVQDRVAELARQSGAGESAFAANVRQVRFNAWHYSDDHLWVGLVEHLFRELAEPGEEDREADRLKLEGELSAKKDERDQLDADLRAVERNRGLLAPFRSAQVARATVSGLWRELRSGGWRTWVAILTVAVGAVGIVLGSGALRWLGGVVIVLGPVVVAWKKLGAYTEAARQRLVARKSEVDAEIKATEEKLTKVDPARRLDKLLQEISTAERYESYRGLTGRIHHDLRRLSDDLAAARLEWDGSGTPPLQRIVLYVDDLDRCTPSRVVDVLQAVNLLLTMDLFVVVVAVDPRWLLRSLRRHHEGLFDGDNEVAYLDKIFHIPIALRPMGDRAVGYLRSLLPSEDAPAPEPTPATVSERQPRHKEVELGARAVQRVVERVVPAVTVAAPAPRPADLNPDGLRLRSVEREFLERLTPLLRTPRAIKKLVNLYRLLRLGVGEDRLGEFIGGEQGGPYQAAALLLAALVGKPHEARELLQELATFKPGVDIVEVVVAWPLRELIVEIRKDIPVHGDSGTYQRWATTVARYGFETYHLFTG